MKLLSLPNACYAVLMLATISFCESCHLSPNAKAANGMPPAKATIALAAAPAETATKTDKPVKVDDATTILNRVQVPILCYHQIRDWRPTDSKTARDYIVPGEAFHQQMKMLADSGYHTINPDQLYDYLTTGAPLPAKPVMLTFDDTDLEQFTVAKPEMDKYGLKGVFFIMTVSLGRPRYMNREQVKTLSDEGHEIASHTWDHKNVKKYEDKDWATQIEKPTKTLENITGKPVKYFAYPFGLWNTAAIPKLKDAGFKAAFQLSTVRDPQDPLYTIRRIIVPGTWNGSTLNTVMQRSFH